jgi:RNA polymerase sigma factor (sigma-70 family)
MTRRHAKIDEQLLAEKLRQLQSTRDPAAFEGIVDMVMDYVYAQSYSRTRDSEKARDLTQEVFATFAAKYSAIREPDRLLSWFRGTVWKCLRTVTKGMQEILTDPVELDARYSLYAAKTPSQLAADAEDRACLARDLQAALKTLTPRQRACLVLKYIEDLSPQEIAHCVGVSKKQVFEFCSKGLRKLAKSEWRLKHT